jgi:TolB protein
MTFDRHHHLLTNFKSFSLAFAGWLFASLITAIALSYVGVAQAQLRVDISGTGAQQYPVAIADFSGDAAGSQIAEIIRADLTRSGQFNLISTSGAALNVDTAIAYDE